MEDQVSGLTGRRLLAGYVLQQNQPKLFNSRVCNFKAHWFFMYTALMEDQVAGLMARGIAAAFLSSTLTAAQRNGLLDDLRAERPSTRVLYVTPESLDSLAPVLERLYTKGAPYRRAALLAKMHSLLCVI